MQEGSASELRSHEEKSESSWIDLLLLDAVQEQPEQKSASAGLATELGACMLQGPGPGKDDRGIGNKGRVMRGQLGQDLGPLASPVSLGLGFPVSATPILRVHPSPRMRSRPFLSQSDPVTPGWKLKPGIDMSGF